MSDIVFLTIFVAVMIFNSYFCLCLGYEVDGTTQTKRHMIDQICEIGWSKISLALHHRCSLSCQSDRQCGAGITTIAL